MKSITLLFDEERVTIVLSQMEYEDLEKVDIIYNIQGKKADELYETLLRELQNIFLKLKIKQGK